MRMSEDQICGIILGGKWLAFIVTYTLYKVQHRDKHHIIRQEKNSDEVIYM